jgi:hypothetical protein
MLSDILPSGSAAGLFVGSSGLFVGGSAAGLFIGGSGLFVGGSAAGLFVGGFIAFVAFLMLERGFAIFLLWGCRHLNPTNPGSRHMASLRHSIPDPLRHLGAFFIKCRFGRSR